MLDFDRFEWLSFDCYGTLVDWETGISTAVAGVLESRGMQQVQGGDSRALRGRRAGGCNGRKSYMEYRHVLREVMAMQSGLSWASECTESELDCLADSLPDWPVFPDVTGRADRAKKRATSWP